MSSSNSSRDDESQSPIFLLDKKDRESPMRVSNFDKYVIATIIGVVFLILSLPFVYRLTNRLFSFSGLRTIKNTGVPNLFGLIVHTIVFILIVRLLMH